MHRMTVPESRSEIYRIDEYVRKSANSGNSERFAKETLYAAYFLYN